MDKASHAWGGLDRTSSTEDHLRPIREGQLMILRRILNYQMSRSFNVEQGLYVDVIICKKPHDLHKLIDVNTKRMCLSI